MAVGAHHREVAPGEADIAQQVIIELHQIGENPLAFRTLEQRSKYLLSPGLVPFPAGAAY